jgi:Orsellinic acid/F9775 biosynthesis cluster protein D
MEPGPAQPIPAALAHLIAVNVEYGVLICIGNGCNKAISPTGILDHMRKQGHPTTKASRKQMQAYAQAFPHRYDHASMPLPTDGLAPQPVIPIVDGLQCRQCTFRSTSRNWTRSHGNKAHSMKRAKDDVLFQRVRLQTWFRDGKERYWVVDESQQAVQERRARRVAIRDAGEGSEPDTGSGSDGEDGADEIIQEIEQWKAAAQARRLQALQNVPVVEMDSWLQYTGWNAVLKQSKHDMVKTYQFTREPEDEPALERVVRAWKRILERGLDTLAAMDQKDTLKWWASPKNEAASQRPFELPQNAKSIDKYSAVWERFICYMMRTVPEWWENETGR